MDFDVKFLEELGLDVQAGCEYTGGKEKLVSAIQRYYKNYEKNTEKIEEALKANDLEQLRIQVHALKSNSKMVGATELSTEFEKLEFAARDGQWDVIKDSIEGVLDNYKGFVESIKPIGEADIEKPADEISGERAKEVVEELLEALDDFDDEKSSQLAGILKGYPFRTTQKEMLDNAISCITDFRYDDAVEIISEIAKTITE